MKIIIVGAGIAGLTLGLACQARGMQVKIVEKTSRLQTIGGGIFLWPHGVSCLQALGLWEILQPVCMSAKCMNLYGHRGNLLIREHYADLYELLAGEIYSVDRSVMQQRLAAQLAEGVLTLGKTCIAIKNHEDHASILYADGTQDSADLIVGADGVHSAVRNAINAEVQPVYSGYCWWGGMVDRIHVPHLPVDEVQYIMGQGKICSIWPAHGERFMWYMPVKMPLAQFTPDTAEQQAKALCEAWHPDVMRLVTAPQSAQRFSVPVYELAPSGKMAASHAVLIGDAACVYGPLLGLGVNKAIEDAFVLSQQLQTSSRPMPALLTHYHQLRASRHQRFFDLEHQAADSLMHDNADMLNHFEEAIPGINLATMYQDMIPLVNQIARSQLLNGRQDLIMEAV